MDLMKAVLFFTLYPPPCRNVAQLMIFFGSDVMKKVFFLYNVRPVFFVLFTHLYQVGQLNVNGAVLLSSAEKYIPAFISCSYL